MIKTKMIFKTIRSGGNDKNQMISKTIRRSGGNDKNQMISKTKRRSEGNDEKIKCYPKQ